METLKESNPKALQVILFAPKEKDLPMDVEKGDVLLVRKIGVQSHDGRTQLCNNTPSTIDLIFTTKALEASPTGDKTHHVLRFRPGLICDVNSEEKQAIADTYKWFKNRNAIDQALKGFPDDQQARLEKARTRMRRRTISEFEDGCKVDLVAEVLHIHPWPFGLPVGKAPVLDLVVIDYTFNAAVRPHPAAQERLGEWTDQGYAITVTCWDEQAHHAATLYRKWQDSASQEENPIWHFNRADVQHRSKTGMKLNVRNEWKEAAGVNVRKIVASDDSVVALREYVLLPMPISRGSGIERAWIGAGNTSSDLCPRCPVHCLLRAVSLINLLLQFMILMLHILCSVFD